MELREKNDVKEPARIYQNRLIYGPTKLFLFFWINVLEKTVSKRQNNMLDFSSMLKKMWALKSDQ